MQATRAVLSPEDLESTPEPAGIAELADLHPDIFDATAKPRARTRGSRVAKTAVVVVDAVAIAGAMALAIGWRSVLSNQPASVSRYWLTGLIALPLWIGLFARYKLYSAAAVSSFATEFPRVLHAVVVGMLCTGLVAISINAQASRLWLILTGGFALTFVLAERSVVRLAFHRARARGQLRRKVVVIGTNAEALGVVQMLRLNPALGYDVVGLLESGTAYGVVAPVPVLGHWNDAVELMREVDATGVIIAASAVDCPLANRLARELMELGYHVEITSGLIDISAHRLIARPLGRRPVMYVEPVRRFGWRRVAKRGFDLAAATMMLVLTAPILLAAAIAIKISSAGPVFFRQQRVGMNGKLFDVIKLRTMVTDAEEKLEKLRASNDADGPLFKMRDDPRVTSVGRVLRKWSIDELPQFWNVLRGEMSIVGPRPALPREVSGWSEDLRNRLRVQPGITGMWQVNGRSSSSFDDYERYDLYYVDNWSLLADLAIVIKTIPAILLSRGAY